jgi:hypothetical protein
MCSTMALPSYLDGNKVTRFGEFSSIGWLFALDSFSIIAKLVQIFGLLFPNVPVMHFFDKNGMGYILGDFSQIYLALLTTHRPRHLIISSSSVYICHFMKSILFQLWSLSEP